MVVTTVITDEATLQAAYAVRKKVFVEEQQVPEEEEYDEFDLTATHIAAKMDGQVVGAARWRFTEKGIKLERFAVLLPYRRSGVGEALLKETLRSVQSNPHHEGKNIYLHAQTSAIGFYQRFGFAIKGEPFDECGIMHRVMYLPALS